MANTITGLADRGETAYTLTINPKASQQKITFNLANKYSDKDIVTVVNGMGIADVKAKATISDISISDKVVDGNYTVTGSQDIEKNVGMVGGYIDDETGVITGTANVNATVKAGSITTDNTENVVSTTIAAGDQIKISSGYYHNDTYYTAQAASDTAKGTVTSGELTSATIGTPVFNNEINKYNVDITATAGAPTVEADGYVSTTSGIKNPKESTITTAIAAASAKVEGSATVLPETMAVENGSAKIASAATTTTPDSGYYVAATAATAANTEINQVNTLTTEGYLGSIDEIDSTGNVTGGAGSKFYIPIKSGSLGVASTDPGSAYNENTSTIVPSAGYLTLEEGYYPNTKISLATIVPDKVNVTSDGQTTVSIDGVDTLVEGSSNIRTGTTVYNADGTMIAGTMNDTSRVSGDGVATGASTNISLGAAVTSEPATPHITVTGKGSVSTGTGYITEGTTSSNTATVYYPINNTAEATITGTNAVEATAAVSGENVVLTSINNGIAVVATGGGSASVDVTAVTSVEGYTAKDSALGTTTLSADSITTTETKYISQITIPADEALGDDATPGVIVRKASESGKFTSFTFRTEGIDTIFTVKVDDQGNAWVE